MWKAFDHVFTCHKIPLDIILDENVELKGHYYKLCSNVRGDFGHL